jgi:hypothetical protein
MSTSTEWIDVDKLAALDDGEFWRLARAEYQQMASLLRSLDEEDWAGRHGRSFRLCLTGPAGGACRGGEDGEEFVLDALAFDRLLSGRGRGDGLLATRIVF